METSAAPQRETIAAAAQRHSVHPETIRRNIRAGRLNTYRLGRRIVRLDPAEVDALFQTTRASQGAA